MLTLVLASCGQAPNTAPESTTAVPAGNSASNAPTLEVAATTSSDAPTSDVTPAAVSEANLAAIKTYLMGQIDKLTTATTALKTSSDRYYELAQAANFDYAALFEQNKQNVGGILEAAKTHWQEASPAYEQMEGIVAGVPSLAEFDVILDAGASGAEDPEGAVPFDLTLPDGRVLPKPGNLFGVTESALWGTFPDYVAADVEADFDGNGTVDFGEAMPDANVLRGAVDAMDKYTADLKSAAEAWQPTEQDAFTALVVMVPTMSEYFESWKNSRFVAGEESTQRDFVVISRLSDIVDILGGLEIVYDNLEPRIAGVDSAQSQQIDQSLTDLRQFVADIYQEEQGGKQFTAEEADLLGSEAQDRATAIAGQISQAAAQLGVEIAE
jgi:hypothetical protein